MWVRQHALEDLYPNVLSHPACSWFNWVHWTSCLHVKVQVLWPGIIHTWVLLGIYTSLWTKWACPSQLEQIEGVESKLRQRAKTYFRHWKGRQERMERRCLYRSEMHLIFLCRWLFIIVLNDIQKNASGKKVDFLLWCLFIILGSKFTQLQEFLGDPIKTSLCLQARSYLNCPWCQ